MNIVQKALIQRDLGSAACVIKNGFGYLEKEKRRQQTEGKRSIDIVAELGSPLIRIFGGNIHKEGMSQKEE